MPLVEHCLPAIELQTGARPQASVIWLHGLGADGHDFEPIVPALGLPGGLAARFVFPHAPAIPVTVNGGYIMPAWYDIRHTDIGYAQDEEGIRRSTAQIDMLIEREQMRGVDPGRIVLAGFSQGGAMALHVGLRQARPLAGIIALSAYLLLPERLQQEWSDAAKATPLFMGHGIDDPVVPFGLGDRARRRLASLGLDVAWHTYPMEHQVCEEEIAAVGRWLTERLDG